MGNATQVFQTNNSSRWKKIKWTGRIMFFFSVFILGVVILAIVHAQNPSTVVSSGNYSGNQTSGELPSYHNKKIKGFKEYLAKKEAEEFRLKQTISSPKTSGQFIRAAFYTPWSGSKSVPSLERYGDKINTIFPEWFFIDTSNNIKLQSRIDSAGLAQMRRRNLRIMPMLTNFNPPCSFPPSKC